MEPANVDQGTPQVEQSSSLHQVTPLSKYLAMALFVILPFVGGYIGYVYSPDKVVEVRVNQENNNGGMKDKEISAGLVLDGECFSSNDQNLSDVNLKLSDEWESIYLTLFPDRYPYELGFYCHFQNDYSLVSFAYEIFLFNEANEIVKKTIIQDRQMVDSFPELDKVNNGLASLYFIFGDGGINGMNYYLLDLNTFTHKKVATQFIELGIAANGEDSLDYRLTSDNEKLFEISVSENSMPITSINIIDSDSATIEVFSAEHEMLYFHNIQLEEIGL